jgi:4'-phosphopantetheinyl transferase
VEIADEVPALRLGDCQVWWADAAVARHAEQPLVTLLDDLEVARWRAFRHDGSQRLYLTGHALARLVLGAHTGIAPRSLRFVARCRRCGDDHGRPRLAEGELEWSLSHSGDQVAVAVVRGTSVGIDIELVRPDGDELPLAALSQRERVVFDRIAEPDRARVFARYWTRKEAVLKATGHGLAFDPALLTMSGPEEPPALIEWAAPDPPSAAPSLVDLRAPAGYEACVAFVGSPATVHDVSGDVVLLRFAESAIQSRPVPQ